MAGLWHYGCGNGTRGFIFVARGGGLQRILRCKVTLAWICGGISIHKSVGLCVC